MRVKYILILLLPAGWLLYRLSAVDSALTERWYSGVFYKGLAGLLSTLTGWLPFSLVEVLALLAVLFAAWWAAALIRGLWRRPAGRGAALKEAALSLLAAAGLLFFLLVGTWGLNFNRLPLADILGLEVRPARVAELAGLCSDLAREAGELRDRVEEDGRGVMAPRGGYRGVFERAEAGFDLAAVNHPQFGGVRLAPKPLMLSSLVSYTGVTGVYGPLTGEANVNVDSPSPLLAATVCHEMSHQRGFAREDEANYIAYLTCGLNPDPDFQYSGKLLGLLHAMNALYRYDPRSYAEIRRGYHPGVQRDIDEIARYSRIHQGPLERNVQSLNDLYLKANNQRDGVDSYGRVVDLLLAERRVR
ncbi:MAG: DUF3810 domain-containing protein [Firmicutes bacterium]|nr:DUF3810 domain-containing protein [Bacillota bacterium]